MQILNYTDASAIDTANVVSPAENGKIRLFKASFVPTSANVAADFVAHEADFTGYPAGGIALTDPEVPTLIGPGVAAFSMGAYTFVSGTPYTVSNVIGGYWTETSDGAVVGYYTFPQSVTIGGLGSGVVCDPGWGVGEVAN